VYRWFIGETEIGYATGTELYRQLDPGDYEYTVKVSDGKGGVAEATVSFTVTKYPPPTENHPPTVILYYSPSNPTDRDFIEFTAEASDPDGDELTYSWFIDDEEQSDTGSTMSTTLSLGDHTVIVKVSDGKGGTDEDHVHLTATHSSGISGDVIEAVLLLPITDATVTVEDLDGNVIRRVSVDEDGKYSVLLPPGTYRVWASAPGYLPSTGMFGAHVEVEQGILEEGVNFRLVMEPANGGKPCSTRWMEIASAPSESPCEVFSGPMLAPGSYMIWTAFNDASAYNTEGLGPHDWKSYGPIDLSGNHNYLVVMNEGTAKDGKVVVKEDDPSIDCYDSRPKDGQGYIYYRNDYISYSASFAIIFCPVSDTKTEGGEPSSTEISTKSFEFRNWGAYKSTNISGKRYFAAYLEKPTQKMLDAGEPIPFLWQNSNNEDLQKNGQLSEVLMDDKEERTLTSSEPLKLEEGYELTIKSIDIDGNKVYIELSKDGSAVDYKVISPLKAGATMADRTYYYRSNVGRTKKIVQIAVYFKNAFRTSDQNLATIEGVFQISDSPLDITTDKALRG
jgi:S-layer protein (TIGR01567 family)